MLAEDQIRRYVIAGSNVVAGIVNFLTIAIPADWQIKQGVLPLEVDRYRRVDRDVWATYGSAGYALTAPGGATLNLTVTVRPGQLADKPGKRAAEEGHCRVGDHDAAYTVTSGQRGLLRKTPVHTLALVFYCPPTKRTLRIEVSGPLPELELARFLNALGWCHCH